MNGSVANKCIAGSVWDTVDSVATFQLEENAKN